jgi:hypothetical protein
MFTVLSQLTRMMAAEEKETDHKRRMALLLMAMLLTVSEPIAIVPLFNPDDANEDDMELEDWYAMRTRHVTVACELANARPGSVHGRLHVTPRFLNVGKQYSSFVVYAFKLPPNAFKMHFRVSKQVFLFLEVRLTDRLQPKEHSFRKDVLLPREIIAIALMRLGSRTEACQLVEKLGRGLSTILNCVDRFCTALVQELMEERVKMPDAAEMAEIAAHFRAEWGMPNCIGALDGTHIRIHYCGEDYRTFRCYKGWTSLHVLAISDHQRRARWASHIDAGCCHDCRSFRRTQLCRDILTKHFPPADCIKEVIIIRARVPLFEMFLLLLLLSSLRVQLLGEHHDVPVAPYVLVDAAFFAHPCLVRPYTGNQLTLAQQLFNALQTSARKFVENLWGDVYNRFRSLHVPLEYRGDNAMERVSMMIYACMTLHNICVDFNDPVPDDDEPVPVPPAMDDGLDDDVAIDEVDDAHNRDALVVKAALRNHHETFYELHGSKARLRRL